MVELEFVVTNATLPASETVYADDASLTLCIREGCGVPFCSSLPNATGARAILTCTGEDPNTDLAFSASPVPNTIGMFFFGPMALGGAASLGDGLLCVGGMTTRITPFVNAGMMMQPPNTANLSVSYTAPYAVGLVGERHFQYWFRSGLSTGTGSNTSDAISITF